MSDPRWPEDGPNWPEHDLRQPEGDESSGTDAPPSSGDEPEPASDPNAPDESPADRPWDESRWDAPRWDDSPWEEPRWAERQPEPQGPEEPRADEPPQVEPAQWADEPEQAAPDQLEPTGEAAPADEPPGSWDDAASDQGSAASYEPAWAPPPVDEGGASNEDEADAGAPSDEQAADEQAADEVAADEAAAAESPDEIPPDDAPAAEPWPVVQAGEDEPPTGAEAPVEAPVLAAAEATTAFGDGDLDWDPRYDGERRRPTTAEQAVPWMIGVILALAGMVIVLLALIFTFPGGLSGDASPSPSATPAPSTTASGVAVGSVEPSSTADASTPTPEPTPGPTPTPVPEYGPLEMIYMGRPSALAPIYLLNRDFSVDTDPTILAQAEQGVGRFAWSPDGRVGVAIIAGRAVALTPGASARALADDITALTFGWDSDTVYAVRIKRDGANDRTEILQIDFVTAAVQTLATITYPHPVTAPDPALREAQFIDNGGLVRLYAVADGNLTLWVLGAPAIYRIDPGDGRVSNLSREPILWAPDGRQRITLNENGSSTVIVLRDSSGDSTATTQVNGLVSHVRWAGTNNEIVFTLGRLGSSGGVRQDLYVWDLADGKAPMPLTSNGISFGAEWRGVAPNWLP